jgi:hypothetical protein
MIRKVLIVSAVFVLVGMLVGVAGCTSLSSNPSPTSSALDQIGSKPTTQAQTSSATLPTTAPANIQSYAGPFVGSKNSNVYHYPWCYEAKKIKAENLVVFATVADACAAWYRPCEVCNPPPCGATPSPTLTPTPLPTTTLSISGPSTIVEGGGGVWNLYINGQLPTEAQATQINWVMVGYKSVHGGPADNQLGGPGAPGCFKIDANGAANVQPGTYPLTATYQGASASFTITRLANPTPFPTVTPTATPFPLPTERPTPSQ